MPGLDWIGKDKVVDLCQNVPFRALERKFSYGDDDGSMIIKGDNLEALKALLPYYEGRINCVYIDPPYNTGNEGWKYNDNVNDPRFRKWLGEIVGKEGEDYSRHDKWLCMIYPRLVLLHRLLASDGVIFISIDDNESARLRLVMDEIWGAGNFVADIVWQRNYSTRNDSRGIVTEAEHLLVYGRERGWSPNKLPRTEKMDALYKNPDNDEKLWTSSSITAPGAATHQGMVYAIQHPFTGQMMYPTAGRHWCYDQTAMLKHMMEWCPYVLKDLDDAEKRAEVCGINPQDVRAGVKGIVLAESLEKSRELAQPVLDRGKWPHFYFTKNGKGGIRRKTYLKEVKGVPPTNLWLHTVAGHTDEAKKEILDLFGGNAFDTPKPTRLIERILQIATKKDSIILDSFAGSGSTGHAVLKLNHEDGGKRKFILVEMEDYALNLTAERIKKAALGYQESVEQNEIIFDAKINIKSLRDGEELYQEALSAAQKAREHYTKVIGPKIVDGFLRVVGSKTVLRERKGCGGGFSYYEMGDRLFDDLGFLNPNAHIDHIRRYVWHTETGAAFRSPQTGDGHYLGSYNGVAYYLFYEPEQPTVLTAELLNSLPRAQPLVVYADCCAVSAKTLSGYDITFKKIPRDVAKI